MRATARNHWSVMPLGNALVGVITPCKDGVRQGDQITRTPGYVNCSGCLNSPEMEVAWRESHKERADLEATLKAISRRKKVLAP